MADINTLSRLVDGFHRQVNLSQNSLVVGSLKVGVSTPTELTKAILDKLVAIQSAADADGTFDTRYTKKTDLAALTTGKGASLVGLEDIGTYFTTKNVEAALQQLASTVGSGDASGITYDPSSSDSLTSLTVQDAIDELDQHATIIKATADGAIQSTEKGSNNGVATLDGGGKIPASQLPSTVMEYKGNWNASINSPALADGSGDAGDVYRVNIAGTQNLGSGSQTYAIGDWVVYNGSVWEKSLNSDAVVSVNGQTGIVVLTTDNVAEGTTNKYFSIAAAKAAAVADSITDGITDVAPSQNAVFDALALKQAASANLDEADTFFGATDLTGAEAEQLSSGVNADSLHSHSSLKISANAGETFAATTLFAVRYAKASDAGFVAGRAYKADIDASTVDNFHVIGLTRPAGSTTAGNPLVITKVGLMTATAHGFTVGLPLYLSTSGALTQTAPSTATNAVVKVGMAVDANTIDVQIQIIGVN